MFSIVTERVRLATRLDNRGMFDVVLYMNMFYL